MKKRHNLLNGDLITTEYEIQVSDPANRPKKPVKIALLSDYHDNSSEELRAGLQRKIGAFDPDLVLCAGDMITAKAGRARMKHAVSLLDELCAQYPVCLSDGNHESRLRMYPERYPGLYRRYRRKLSEAGAIVLNNRSRIMKVHGMRILVSGFVQELDDYSRIHPGRICAEDLDNALGEISEAHGHLFRLLIAHMPDHFKAYAQWGADLTVSGHLHGGVIRIPVLGGLIGGSLKPFPKYDKGLFEMTGKDGKARRMIVSAGLGQHTLVFRVNNPPELILIRLV